MFETLLLNIIFRYSLITTNFRENPLQLLQATEKGKSRTTKSEQGDEK